MQRNLSFDFFEFLLHTLKSEKPPIVNLFSLENHIKRNAHKVANKME